MTSKALGESRVTDHDKTLSDRLGRAGGVFVVAYIVIEQLVLPVVRPLARLLAKFPPVVWIAHGAAKLPPYGALVALVIPLVVAEPAKWFGLFLIADSRVLLGTLVIVGAYLVSLLIVDRIYEAAKPNLLRIQWFAKIMAWLVAVRDAMKERLRTAAAGRWIRAKFKTLFNAA